MRALPMLARYIFSQDPEILHDAAWALAFIRCGRNAWLASLHEAGRVAVQVNLWIFVHMGTNDLPRCGLLRN